MVLHTIQRCLAGAYLSAGTASSALGMWDALVAERLPVWPKNLPGTRCTAKCTQGEQHMQMQSMMTMRMRLEFGTCCITGVTRS